MQFELQERQRSSPPTIRPPTSDLTTPEHSSDDLRGSRSPQSDINKLDMAAGDDYFSGGARRDSDVAPPKPLHEESPLLTSDDSDEDEDDSLIDDVDLEAGSPQEDDYQESKGLAYMILLTISIGGLQLAWSTELSNGTPYLLSLGLSKSIMALVWIAGPLSGALVQPYVGIRSDNCRSSWGKRTPFMFFGSLATIASLLCLAWVRDIVGGILGLFHVDTSTDAVKYVIIVVAVFFVYILDFSINTGMFEALLALLMLTTYSTSRNPSIHSRLLSGTSARYDTSWYSFSITDMTRIRKCNGK